MDNHYKPINEKLIMWGKYKGKLFSEVPTVYLSWFVKCGYPQMKNRRQWAEEELKRRQNENLL
jgi:uncharacterized protein (DUF3820 family)